MINERMLKGSAPHEDCRGKAECSLLQKENFRKLIDGKNATRFPFWRERGTASLWLVVESRMLYVKPLESMPMCSV